MKNKTAEATASMGPVGDMVEPWSHCMSRSDDKDG